MQKPKSYGGRSRLWPSTGSFIVAGLLLGQSAIADITVAPETVTAVEMSNTDVNRIVCSNGVVNDAFFSQEKGVTVTNNGSSAFVKFLIKRDGINPDIYASARAEFYIVCDGVVYTLMATPKKIGAQTIWLTPGAGERIERNLAEYGPQVEEDRAVSLTMAVMQDRIPDSYRVAQTAYEDMVWYEQVIPDAKVSKRRDVRVEGIGFTLTEYWIQPDHDIQLDEGMLLNPWFGNQIFAITFDSLNGRANRISRAFVVTRRSR